MRLSVLIYVPSTREQIGRRPAKSLTKEYRARLRASRISTGLLVRFVALLVRFTVNASTATFRPATGGGDCGLNASVSVRVGMEEGARSQYACLDPDTLSASAIARRSLRSARYAARRENGTHHLQMNSN
jgi:hypothetical protein